MATEPPSHKYSFGVLVNRIADEHPLRNLMTWSLLLMEHGETDFWMAVADPRISRAIKQYELHQARDQEARSIELEKGHGFDGTRTEADFLAWHKMFFCPSPDDLLRWHRIGFAYCKQLEAWAVQLNEQREFQGMPAVAADGTTEAILDHAEKTLSIMGREMSAELRQQIQKRIKETLPGGRIAVIESFLFQEGLLDATAFGSTFDMTNVCREKMEGAFSDSCLLHLMFRVLIPSITETSSLIRFADQDLDFRLNFVGDEVDTRYPQTGYNWPVVAFDVRYAESVVRCPNLSDSKYLPAVERMSAVKDTELAQLMVWGDADSKTADQWLAATKTGHLLNAQESMKGFPWGERNLSDRQWPGPHMVRFLALVRLYDNIIAEEVELVEKRFALEAEKQPYNPEEEPLLASTTARNQKRARLVPDAQEDPTDRAKRLKGPDHDTEAFPPIEPLEEEEEEPATVEMKSGFDLSYLYLLGTIFGLAGAVYLIEVN